MTRRWERRSLEAGGEAEAQQEEEEGAVVLAGVLELVLAAVLVLELELVGSQLHQL